jgi:ryanodine receptor 2
LIFFILVGEIQLASYKILNALWILGTCGTKLIDRVWIIDELNRHRPLLGECLGSLASCFPIAFLEPELNSNNIYSIMYGLTGSNLSEHSLEAQDVMSKLAKNLPHLDALINELRELSESGNKYNEAPYVIEVILPTVCSYLNYWWTFGPSAREAQKNLNAQQSVDQEKTPPPAPTGAARLQKDHKSHTPTPTKSNQTPVLEKREE